MLSPRKIAQVIVFAALTVAASFGASVVLEACTPQARAVIEQDGIDVALCIAENQDLPEAIVVTKCIKDGVTPQDVQTILEKQRAATKRAAIHASCSSPSSPVQDAGR